LFVGLLLLVFMCVVWSMFTGIRLPTFFQRLAGLVNSLLAMLVVMFAIREYGKRYNRLPLPWFGRVSTSRIAGGLTFLAVFAWWLSPWAPIPAGAAEPDLVRLLEQGLDVPQLCLIDDNLASVDPPTPSTAAREAAALVAPDANPFRMALVMIARGRYADAENLINQAEQAGGISAREIQLVRAQLDCYAGRYDAASRRYGELLRQQPMYEDFLAHGAFAAMLSGDFETADRRAEQLLEQARVRARESVRLRQAVNLLVALRVLQGRFFDAWQFAEQTQAGRERAARSGDWQVFDDPQLAADANNAAVLSVLDPRADSRSNPSQSPAVAAASAGSTAAGLVLAKRLWSDWNLRHGQSREQPDLRVAVVVHNLGMVALGKARFDQADELFGEERTLREQVAAGRNDSGLGISLNSLAEVARIEARYADAETLLPQTAERLVSLPPADPNRLAVAATRAALDADLGRSAEAEREFKEIIRQAQQSLAREHPFVAILDLRLAEIQLQSGQLADAQAMANGAVAILDGNQLGKQPATARALRIAGLAALRQGNRDLAQRDLEQAATILAPPAELPDGYPPAALESAALAAARGELAVVLETYSAAEADYERALKLVDEMFGERAAQHPLRAEYLVGLARLRVRQGKLSDAVTELEAALAIREKALPQGNAETVATLEELAGLLEKSGRPADAAARRSEAEQLRATRKSSPAAP
jgi:tetratricopeptide (TPR) repeat protein